MTEPIRPPGPIERRTGDRRDGERREGLPPGPTKALIPVDEPAAADPAPEHAPEATAPPPSPAAFAAQVLGQDGGRKGLRGGPPVLDAARSTYLGTEYSGPHERRPKPGKATKTEA